MTNAVDFIHADWPAPAGIVAGCTLRSGGISEGVYASLNLGVHVDDDAVAVIENRRRFRLAANLEQEPQWLEQVHGADVVVDPEGGHIPRADAIVCGQPSATAAVLVADCLPVLFCSTDGRFVAAAHAGWRGLAAGVLEATFAAFNSAPDDTLAWLGPAISQRHFEVGQEVRAAFVDVDSATEAHFIKNAAGRWQADLGGLARHRLGKLGIGRVYGQAHCTFDDSQRFFSYRRDGQTGRMAAFIAKQA